MPISYAFSLMTQLNEQLILDSLRQIKDPDLHKDIVTLGFIRDLKIDGGHVSFRIVLTTPACPSKPKWKAPQRRSLAHFPALLQSP
jgi:ATP-binding protein involved in chromosome partitioning